MREDEAASSAFASAARDPASARDIDRSSSTLRAAARDAANCTVAPSATLRPRNTSLASMVSIKCIKSTLMSTNT